MKKHLPQYPGLDLVSIVYGNDLADDSYREATALLQKYPDLKVIVSPSSVGIVASAKAVEDAKKVGQVYVTGLGLPSECAGHVDGRVHQELRDLEPDRSRLHHAPMSRSIW